MKQMSLIEIRMKKFCLTLIIGLACFPLFGQLIERDADKLVIGNSVIKREMGIKDRQCFTQSIKIARSDRNFVGNNSEEFAFLLDGKWYNGRSGWEIVSVLEKKHVERGDGVEIRLTNHDLRLDVVLLYVFYHDLPVIKKSIGFVNRSSAEMHLEAVDVEKLHTSLNQAILFSSFGRQKNLSTYFGDHDDALCIVHHYGSNSGILFANETPGVLKKLTYNLTMNDVSVGLTDKTARYPFGKYLAPGQEWTSPSVVLLPYSNTMDPWIVMNNEFADYQRKYAGFSLFENRNRRLSFMYNNYIPFYDNFNEKLILELAEAAAQCGIRQFAIDCGWYTTQHAPATGVSWINNCGDWMVDKTKFPRGLKPVFDRIRALGLEPGLWVSVASASEWAEVFRSHPEWRLLDVKGEPVNIHDGSTHLRTMCFATDWKAYTKAMLTEMVQEWGIKYFKLDLAAVTSAYINEAGRSGCYATDHPGHKDHAESYIAIYTGLFQLFDELHRQFPDLYIDCTFETEGKMQAIDYAFRKHADGNWLTNFEEAYPVGNFRIRNLAWWRSPAMPASSMLIGNRRLDTPEAINELRTMMGVFPIMLGDLRTIAPEKRQEIKRWGDWIVELQKKYDYDFYRRDLPGFGEPSEGAWDGYARINTDTKRGGIIGIFRQGAPDDRRIVLIDGLLPDKTYAIKPDPSVSLPVRYLTGKALAETGFEVRLEKKYEGQLFEIELVE
jgi:alpha-galactosidase